MAGRLHGEGSIYREGDYWVASVEAGRDPVTGRRVRRKLKARTKRELVARMAEVRQQLETGSGGRATSVTVGEFLHRWLDDVVAPRVESANTVHNYRSVVTAHIVPSLGSVRLSKLTPEMVDQFLASRARAGLSRSYVGRMRAVLTSALRHAERRSLVSRNAAALAVMPRCEPTASRRSLTVDEARALIGAAAGERLGALVVCGLALGLRPGELTGLLWTDLQLEAERPQLSVSGSMKRRPDSSLYRGPVKRSKAGERTVALGRRRHCAVGAPVPTGQGAVRWRLLGRPRPRVLLGGGHAARPEQRPQGLRPGGGARRDRGRRPVLAPAHRRLATYRPGRRCRGGRRPPRRRSEDALPPLPPPGPPRGRGRRRADAVLAGRLTGNGPVRRRTAPRSGHDGNHHGE
jgi:hypothetical protein